MDVKEQFEKYKEEQTSNEVGYLQKELQTQQIQNKLIEKQFLDLQKLTVNLQQTLKAVSANHSTNQNIENNTANSSYEFDQKAETSKQKIQETVKEVTCKIIELKSELQEMSSMDQNKV